MMGLREIESHLPPGFRFHPSDEELICHYLFKKVNNERKDDGAMVEVDLHTSEPWELPEAAKVSENEWYFFSFLDRKYATGMRANRATKSGYWKATGKDRMVCDPVTHTIVGMRKTLVFYRGRAPNGIKTSFVMHEFRLGNSHMPPKENWVLCRVCHKRKEEVEMNSDSFSHQPFMGKEIENSVFPNGAQSSSSFPDMNNLMQCNFLDFTPEYAQGFDLPFDVGTEENVMQYENLVHFSY